MAVMILDVLIIVEIRFVRVICPMSHLTEQKQVGSRAVKTSAKSHAGGGSVTYVMTRQWTQRMFGSESGRGWGSTPPLLVTLRGKQPMMRSKGQRPGLTTATLKTILSLRAWCVHDQVHRSRCILPALPAIHQAPRIRSGALKHVRTSRRLDVLLRRSQTSNQVISTDVSIRLMCP